MCASSQRPAVLEGGGWRMQFIVPIRVLRGGVVKMKKRYQKHEVANRSAPNQREEEAGLVQGWKMPRLRARPAPAVGLLG